MNVLKIKPAVSSSQSFKRCTLGVWKGSLVTMDTGSFVFFLFSLTPDVEIPTLKTGLDETWTLKMF